ncbi:hypothetical protein MIND_00569200 [Mycena indigotica]|uniref:Uncharacterized protein n=1 Tax=Mycena indigotica TaxID=2126181 RepID=A0A8H6W3A3_9AGAR|nr:uncharacterized protein MIND_00569200 [Mycena indigotica]KAF7303407.1 hypothetical protein MIND_00569200 [Mycena indigotica]
MENVLSDDEPRERSVPLAETCSDIVVAATSSPPLVLHAPATEDQITSSDDALLQPAWSDRETRDTPTCQHFLEERPVERTTALKRGQPVFNRAGQAICRIMARNAKQCWTYGRIAAIFGVSYQSVQRAVENKSADDVADDYEAAGDPDFSVYFPPLPPGSRSLTDSEKMAFSEDYSEGEGGTSSTFDSDIIVTTGLNRAAKDSFYKRLGRLSDAGYRNPTAPDFSHKRPITDTFTDSDEESAASSPVDRPYPYFGPVGSLSHVQSFPHMFGPTNHPIVSNCASTAHSAQGDTSTPKNNGARSVEKHIRRALPKPRLEATARAAGALSVSPLQHCPPKSSDVGTFLKTALPYLRDDRFASYVCLLERKGFTVGRLHAMAGWQKQELKEAGRLLTVPSKERPDERMVPIEYAQLVQAVQKLGGAKKSLDPCLPPVGANPLHSSRTLADFLRYVMGFDLSGRKRLCEIQGITVVFLCEQRKAKDDGELRELLEAVLLDDEDALMYDEAAAEPRMTALEVLAVELAIRRARTAEEFV